MVLVAPQSPKNKPLIISGLFHFTPLALSEICPKIFYPLNTFYILIDHPCPQFDFFRLNFFSVSDKIRLPLQFFQGLFRYSVDNSDDVGLNLPIGNLIFIPSPIMACRSSLFVGNMKNQFLQKTWLLRI